MRYKVIQRSDFKKYNVRNVPERAALVLAWVQESGGQEYCVNVITVSSSFHDIISLVRDCKEKNVELHKKNMEKEKRRTIYSIGQD